MQEERHVKFDQGKVSYLGKTDILCSFATVTVGNQEFRYYELNDQKLDNTYHIVSDSLKEAIDPSVPRSHIGLINSSGEVIIPLENKAIKILDDKFLLVVRNNPKTQSVVDAIASREDPKAAEKMVIANSAIKDKINKKMGEQGRFILNNLLSEGTICRTDGSKVMDQYVSFIGMTDDEFFCSTNVVDSEVITIPRNINISMMGDFPIVEPEEANREVENLDVSNVGVSKTTIDTALNSYEEDKEEMPEEKEEAKSVIPVVSENGFSPLPEVNPDSISSNLFAMQNTENQALDSNDKEEVNDSLEAVDNTSLESNDEVVDHGDDLEGANLDDLGSDDDLGQSLVSAVSALVEKNKKMEDENSFLQTKIDQAKINEEEIQQLRNRVSQLELQNAQKDQKIISLQHEKEQIQVQQKQLIQGLRGALSGTILTTSNNDNAQVLRKVA